MPGGASKGKVKKHFKAKHQKKRVFRSSDPVISVFMWGVNHTVNELVRHAGDTVLLLPDDFKAFSKIRVENQYYNKEYLPGHFKFKEYCPLVFHDLRRRFQMDEMEYLNSLSNAAPVSSDSPGKSDARFFTAYDKKLVIKSLTSEEVALVHHILREYHAHVVTTEGQTLLPQYLGMYRITVNGAETYLMVMRNVFSSRLKMHKKYDLKGSTVARAASNKEKEKSSPTFKDNDFIHINEKVFVGEEQKLKLLKALEADVKLLEKLHLMDYSLLVGINDCILTAEDGDDSDAESNDGLDKNGYASSDDGLGSPITPGSFVDPADMLEVTSSDQQVVSKKSGSGDDSKDEGNDLSPEPPGAFAVLPGDQSSGKGSGPGSGQLKSTSSPLHVDPAVVVGSKAVEAAYQEGKFPVVDKTVDVYALQSSSDAKPQIYYMAIIDVLTVYGARKRAAHAAKTFKTRQGGEISTVNPELYARRFLEFMTKIME
ncbi:phosphatidylinositol 5-phosphate 4-kinase type-2 alpha-like [Dysidea avara]|uniref:phosphatidylinositol 5-phosphate 4-kinase type-2 alpha-like n=1 Tax=Dysidea avara TaxID=196820 RepID=UPI00331C6AED